MGNKLVACAVDKGECLADTSGPTKIYRRSRRGRKPKSTSSELNLDAVAHVSSPEKYVSQNLNNNLGGINDKDAMMEKVLEENRRLTLLMQKMSKENRGRVRGDEENDGRVINSMDFFGDDMDGELNVNDESFEFGSLHSPAGGHQKSRTSRGHKLFVDQMLGISSEYLSKAGHSPKPQYTKHIDRATGKTYYYDPKRKKSVWASELQTSK
jgi:hypothetical protein